MSKTLAPSTPTSETQFASHIHSLMEVIARSPYAIAPEKKNELLAIQNRNSAWIQIDDGGETDFKFEALFGRIHTSIRSLQHIWAAACYFASLYSERIEAAKRGETQIQITGNPNIEMAQFLYEGSCAAFEQELPMPWPPKIEEVMPNPDYLALADELFVLMCSFALLHEIGHLELGHNKIEEAISNDESPKDEQTIELEADKWAYDWSLSTWKSYGLDERIFIKRTLGVIFALAMTEEFHYLSKTERSFSTHPRAVDRLIQFHDDYESQISENSWGNTCFTAISVGLQMVAIHNGKGLPTGPYHGIRDFLGMVKQRNLDPQTEAMKDRDNVTKAE